MSAWTELPTAAKIVAWAEHRQPWDRDDVTMATALLRQAAIELNSLTDYFEDASRRAEQAERERDAAVAGLQEVVDMAAYDVGWVGCREIARAALAAAGVPDRKQANE